MPRPLFTAIAIMAAVGVFVSVYGLWQHYAPAGSSFCNISAIISCDFVNQSAWSEIAGIPVAAIGIFGYLAIFALALAARWESLANQRLLAALLLGLGSLGLVLQLIFTYIELAIIGAICPICIASQIIIFVIAVIAFIAWRRALRAKLSPLSNAQLPTPNF
ncbi:MAG: vitamin K epoxide reductase family protein [Candidatus Uhrbacteria bacterium]